MTSRPFFFTLLALTLLSLSSSVAESKGKTVAPAVCDIVGTVERMTRAQSSSWNNGGVPSAMSGIETHLYVTVQERTPHNKNPDSENACTAKPKGMRTYKLCSLTPVKQGDRIQGTEATQTGSKRAVGCLFDLVVLPKQS